MTTYFKEEIEPVAQLEREIAERRTQIELGYAKPQKRRDERLDWPPFEGYEGEVSRQQPQ